jgi:hypothetical protein
MTQAMRFREIPRRLVIAGEGSAGDQAALEDPDDP